MERKFFSCLFAIALVLFAFAQNVNATIYSEADIYQKINQLNTLIDQDFVEFVNKSDLVGYRLDSFKMSSANYKNVARMTVEKLRKMLEQINSINQSSEFSDSDKSMQIARIYQEATTDLYNMDTQTINFMIGLNQFMPTITYSRFVKKYQEFYNGLDITNTDLSVDY
ncbi:MAG: hypothetical protein IJY61_08855 [Candidatus Gastranaerophilales bacterium]|nr:hypothetical protein [Candidatus Gastranaerophilales bacterium]